MARSKALGSLVALALAACGDSTPQPKAVAKSPPIRMACTTPEQAGLKAQDITRKLVEARKDGAITQDQYVAFITALSDGFRVWGETQNLAGYCAALQSVVTDAALR